MTTRPIFGCIGALVFMGAASTPVAAADHAAMAVKLVSSTPAAKTPALAATPPEAKVEMSCPATPAGVVLSDTMQRFFQIITYACELKTSGLITDDQFVMIRDKAVTGIYTELLAATDESQNRLASK